MGLIISRFRKKQSTKDILEQIQNDIISIEEYSQHTQARQKRLVGSLVLYSILLCLVSLVICYFYYLPTTLQDHLIIAGAFFGFVLLVYILKRILTWWYRRKLSRNERKLTELKEKKEKILEQVMETETYKVAKEILEKYAPEQLRKNLYGKSPVAPAPSNASPRMPSPSSGSEVRRRLVPQAGQNNSGNQMAVRPASPIGQQAAIAAAPNIHRQIGSPQLQGAPRPGGPSAGRIATSPNHNSTQQHPSGPVSSPPTGPTPPGPPPPPGHPSGPPPGHHAFVTHPLSRAGGAPPGPPMPRPVLPRERGYLDRFIEYLVGDGPANRFALVCRQCESHNGMALKEEFEYLAFRCAYCYYWNPSRKQRPSAPRLETLAPPPPPPRLQVAQDEEEEEEENEESSSGEEEEEEEGGQEEGSLEDMAKSGVSSEASSSSPSEEAAAEHRAAPAKLLPHQTLNGPPSDTTDSTSTSTTPSSPSEPDHNVQ